jgi:hypothetical protein
MNAPSIDPQPFLNALENLNKVDIAPMNEQGVIVIVVKKDVTADPAKFNAFSREFVSLKYRLGRNIFCKMIPNLQAQAICSKLLRAWVGSFIYQLDIGATHRNRLYNFFNPSVTKEEAIESLDFLLSHGWSEEKIQAEMHISAITLYRYRKLSSGKKGDFQAEKPEVEEDTAL